ncbi:MAG: hypothetical protein KGN01_06190 [Patescibacteria group bacterium]|nr:hypothetical protein [Patescibacteria group bacterium]
MKLEQALEKERFMTTMLAGGPGSGRRPGGGSGGYDEEDFKTDDGTVDLHRDLKDALAGIKNQLPILI